MSNVTYTLHVILLQWINQVVRFRNALADCTYKQDWKGIPSEYTDILGEIMSHCLGCSCTNVIWGQCCVSHHSCTHTIQWLCCILAHSCNDVITKNCYTTMMYNNVLTIYSGPRTHCCTVAALSSHSYATMGPVIAQQWVSLLPNNGTHYYTLMGSTVPVPNDGIHYFPTTGSTVIHQWELSHAHRQTDEQTNMASP
jgi:hypothetical protein